MSSLEAVRRITSYRRRFARKSSTLRMMTLVLLAGLAALASWGLALWVCLYGARLGLIQAPNHRSAHDRPTPVGGGLGVVVAGTAVGVALLQPPSWSNGTAALLLALPLAAVSLRNDIREISAGMRLAVQTAVWGGVLGALGDVPALDLPLVSFHGPILSMLLLFFGVWWINLFNFMDGIDGIAGSQAVFMLTLGVVLAAGGGEEIAANPELGWMLGLAGATVGFLFLNWAPARIFMGDVGSTYLAFMILALAMLTVHAGWLDYATWLIMGAIFVADTSYTLLVRMHRGDKWYEPHDLHGYQILFRRWGSHARVARLAVVVNLVWVAPLALASVLFPLWNWGLVALTYAPLVAAEIILGAGVSPRGR